MKRFLSLFCCFALILSLVACGADSSYDGGAKYMESAESYVDNGWSASEGGSDPAAAESPVLKERKQIYRYELSLKTASYDELTEKIRGETRDLGGFVESMDESQYGDSQRTRDHSDKIHPRPVIIRILKPKAILQVLGCYQIVFHHSSSL